MGRFAPIRFGDPFSSRALRQASVQPRQLNSRLAAIRLRWARGASRSARSLQTGFARWVARRWR